MTPETASTLREIAGERGRQDAQWGEQNWPDGTSTTLRCLADDARRACDRAADGGYLTWFDILTEEFYEAMSETHTLRLRRELVQLAAVAANWIEAIDRRTRTVSPS